ncbi:ferritin, heavy subunit-like [Pipistrellus kuhlii]|uniref:ferritin, heavy subunit-like n=1 Tax=Pipistrellus kuhlii TaxID=59472 RepID=UPI00174F6621|nr:ferritin, heavy subunit-like [Pipistrellus kuhlii]
MAAMRPVSEECRIAINYVASFELHISDAYLSMAYCYPPDTEEPIFSGFFEDQAELKRDHGKQFLKYLIERENNICLPVIKRPDVDNWYTGVKAVEYALELENQLSQLLIDLKTTASADNDNHFLNFMGKYLEKQKKNSTYLQRQLAYYRKEEQQAQEGGTPKKKKAC